MDGIKPGFLRHPFRQGCNLKRRLPYTANQRSLKGFHMARSIPLVVAVAGNFTLPYRVAMVLLGALLVSIAAQVSVPMYPVPMTLQTLAIMLVGLTYGARLAGTTLLTYLVLGIIGLPVFAGAAFGPATLLGPTGGYLLGFVISAFIMGWLVERGFSSGLGLFLAALSGTAILFVPGVLWLQWVTPLDVSGAFFAGAAPFLLGEVSKAALAALLITGVLRVLHKPPQQ